MSYLDDLEDGDRQEIVQEAINYLAKEVEQWEAQNGEGGKKTVGKADWEFEERMNLLSALSVVLPMLKKLGKDCSLSLDDKPNT